MFKYCTYFFTNLVEFMAQTLKMIVKYGRYRALHMTVAGRQQVHLRYTACQSCLACTVAPHRSARASCIYLP